MGNSHHFGQTVNHEQRDEFTSKGQGPKIKKIKTNLIENSINKIKGQRARNYLSSYGFVSEFNMNFILY